MAIQERLDHGLHNEEVCNLLFNAQKWDWTVTSAFYSALHFVQSKIFPLQLKTTDDKTFSVPNFNVYFRGGHHKVHNMSKHEILIELVEKYCPDIAPDYCWLHDTCRNARYHHYNTTEKTARRALKCLERVKNFCIEG